MKCELDYELYLALMSAASQASGYLRGIDMHFSKEISEECRKAVEAANAALLIK